MQVKQQICVYIYLFRKPAALRDIIPLFAKNIIAIDATERDLALQQAAVSRKKCLELEAQHSQTLLMCQVYQGEAERSKHELMEAKREIEWFGLGNEI